MKTTYQYQLIPVSELCSPLSVLAPGQDDRKRVEEGLNYHGRQGWKLTAVIGPLAVFEREVEQECSAGTLCNKNFQKGNDNEHNNERTKLG